MELTTIREVSQAFGVSTRTLRYYEEVGLLKSTRQPDSAYRAYDGEALRSLKQILVLRALRLPLKQIGTILQGGEIQASLQLLEDHAQAVMQEMDLLAMIQSSLLQLINHLHATGQLTEAVLPLDEDTARSLIRSLSVPLPTIKKEDNPMTKLTDVRILFLPPATVCSVHTMGPSAEMEAGIQLDAFIKANDLFAKKPDARVYGFNHPNGKLPDGSDHGYELWLTIPDDMPLAAPYAKKQFAGGLYAAHMIPIGAFEEWEWIVTWVQNSSEYEPRWGPEDMMAGLLEEHLNSISHVGLSQAEKDKVMQLDLLVPIQAKK